MTLGTFNKIFWGFLHHFPQSVGDLREQLAGYKGAVDLHPVGVIAGLWAYVIGYVAMLIAVSTDQHGIPEGLTVWTEDVLASLHVAGMTFHQHHLAHNEGIWRVIGAPEIPIYYSLGFETWLLLLPIFLLAVAGLLVARWRYQLTQTVNEWHIGLSIAIGYLAMTILGIIFMSFDLGGRTTLGAQLGTPSLARSLFIMGLLYPILFGIVGAVAAKIILNSDSRVKNQGNGL